MEPTKLLTLCVHHSGADPSWRGGPTRAVARYINKITYKDEENGRLYYRSEKLCGRMVELKYQEDYDELNLLVLAIRKQKQDVAELER